jgi:hypothetical protein
VHQPWPGRIWVLSRCLSLALVATLSFPCGQADASGAADSALEVDTSLQGQPLPDTVQGDWSRGTDGQWQLVLAGTEVSPASTRVRAKLTLRNVLVTRGQPIGVVRWCARLTKPGNLRVDSHATTVMWRNPGGRWRKPPGAKGAYLADDPVTSPTQRVHSCVELGLGGAERTGNVEICVSQSDELHGPYRLDEKLTVRTGSAARPSL